jgi:hypothetical protein
MKLTASKLRQDIYRILDEIIATGQPVEIERNGVILKIMPMEHSFRKLSKLQQRRLTEEDSDNFTHIDWTAEWKAD